MCLNIENAVQVKGQYHVVKFNFACTAFSHEIVWNTYNKMCEKCLLLWQKYDAIGLKHSNDIWYTNKVGCDII